MSATALWDSQDPRSKRWMDYSAEHNTKLEAAFQHPNKPDVEIDLGGYPFTVSVKSMTQTNAKGFGRPVRRSDTGGTPGTSGGGTCSGGTCSYGGAAKPTAGSGSALQKLLGSDKLVSKTGEVDTATLEGKTLLIYFSAHWCPPCRGFTPKLAQFYNKLKESGRNDFELVFASSDQSEEEFKDYFKESHGDWLALPYAARGAKAALSKHFKVEGIPTLAVVDADGNTITTDGRGMVDSDPEGKKFPWKPRTILDILASAKMTSKNGTPLTVDDLKQKDAFALYFSAHWCPPCRGFTPKLAGTYQKMQEAGQNMEIVFVSSDREEGEYKAYWGEMPWAAMAFKDDAVAELKKLCEVSGIPSLATFKGSDGSIINSNARGAAGNDEAGTNFPWA